MQNFSPYEETFKKHPQNRIADWGLKVLQTSQNSTFAYFSVQRLLMQKFNPFGETVKTTPKTALQIAG